jgi:hypothetical protein
MVKISLKHFRNYAGVIQAAAPIKRDKMMAVC